MKEIKETREMLQALATGPQLFRVLFLSRDITDVKDAWIVAMTPAEAFQIAEELCPETCVVNTFHHMGTVTISDTALAAIKGVN